MFKGKKLLLFSMLAVVLALSACGGDTDNADNSSNSDNDTIVVSGKDYTEQVILTNILAEYLKENTDLNVEVKGALGAVFVLQQAMEKGDIDMYVEYTGTGYLNVLDKDYEPGASADQLYDETKEGYMDEFNIKWLEPLGYNNQYALTLRGDQAEELGVETSSELIDHTDELVFGSNGEFYERGDGYDAMVDEYGFDFKDTVTIDEDLMYKAVKDGEMDVITGYTTDPRIQEFDLATMEDDKEFFPPYDAVPIIRQEVLDAHPELEDVINELAESGAFDNDTMSELNGKVSTDGEKEQDVAIEFLKENDLID